MTNYPCLVYRFALTVVKYWLLLDNSSSMCEILSDIYELAVIAIVMMNMQERIFNTYC